MKKVIIDMKSWKDRESAHESLKEELGFPDWYGKNADALYDLLTEGDYSIVLCNAETARAAMGKELDRLLKVMRDAGALDRVYDAMPAGENLEQKILEAAKKWKKLEETDGQEEREKILRSLVHKLGSKPAVGKGFRCLTGRQIRVGDDFCCGTDLFIRDEAPVTIGDRVRIGDRVTILTADPAEQDGTPALVRIGSDVRIGSGSILLPGARLEDGALIPPGSVVR